MGLSTNQLRNYLFEEYLRLAMFFPQKKTRPSLVSDALPLRSPFSRRIARRTWLLPFLWWNKPRRQLALRWCFFMGGFSRASDRWKQMVG